MESETATRRIAGSEEAGGRIFPAEDWYRSDPRFSRMEIEDMELLMGERVKGMIEQSMYHASDGAVASNWE